MILSQRLKHTGQAIKFNRSLGGAEDGGFEISIQNNGPVRKPDT